MVNIADGNARENKERNSKTQNDRIASVNLGDDLASSSRYSTPATCPSIQSNLQRLGFFELACAAGRTDLSRGRRRSECGQKNIVFLSFFLQQPLPQQRPGDAALPSFRGLIRRKRCGCCCCPGCRCPLFFFGLAFFFFFSLCVCGARDFARAFAFCRKSKRKGVE